MAALLTVLPPVARTSINGTFDSLHGCAFADQMHGQMKSTLIDSGSLHAIVQLSFAAQPPRKTHHRSLRVLKCKMAVMNSDVLQDTHTQLCTDVNLDVTCKV